jgi:hypothetical protein
MPKKKISRLVFVVICLWVCLASKRSITQNTLNHEFEWPPIFGCLLQLI